MTITTPSFCPNCSPTYSFTLTSLSKVPLTLSADREITYYYIEGDVFINCGIFPVGDEIKIDLKEIDRQEFLHIRAKNLGLTHIDRLMYTQSTVSNFENEKE